MPVLWGLLEVLPINPWRTDKWTDKRTHHILESKNSLEISLKGTWPVTYYKCWIVNHLNSKMFTSQEIRPIALCVLSDNKHPAESKKH